jgi:transcriptional regulator with XRE-family HTH domain
MIKMVEISSMDERKILGKNIKRYRQFRGLGGEDLAKKVGLTKTHISRLETGNEQAKNIGLDYLIKISRELGISMEELFIEDGNLLSLRFVISDHNINTLKEVIQIVKDLIEKK